MASPRWNRSSATSDMCASLSVIPRPGAKTFEIGADSHRNCLCRLTGMAENSFKLFGYRQDRSHSVNSNQVLHPMTMSNSVITQPRALSLVVHPSISAKTADPPLCPMCHPRHGRKATVSTNIPVMLLLHLRAARNMVRMRFSLIGYLSNSEACELSRRRV